MDSTTSRALPKLNLYGVSPSGELNNTENNLSYGSVVGAGVAIKFQFPPEAQSNGFTGVSPVLRDPSGLMSASHNHLVNKNSYN